MNRGDRRKRAIRRIRRIWPIAVGGVAVPKFSRIYCLAALLLLCASWVQAQEIDQSAEKKDDDMSISATTAKLDLARVEIEMEVLIDAPPQRVYDAYVNETGKWWSRDYVMGGDRTVDLLLEPQPGGRLLEVFDNGGGNVWAVVTGIDPGRSIRLGVYDGMIWSGAGSFSLTFEPDGEGTLLKLSHTCTEAYSEDGHSGYAQGWSALIGERLKQYVEAGAVDDPVRR